MINYSVLTEPQKNLFEKLISESWIREFYLAGGTALAMHLGHRMSDDFDFFMQKDINKNELLKNIAEFSNYKLLSEDVNTLYISINNIKISFISYKYEIIEKFIYIENISISGVRDISGNKLSDISSRGSKKDFIDLYFILRYKNIKEVFEDFCLKYGKDYFNKYHILKSLVFFDNADSEPMPVMIENLE